MTVQRWHPSHVNPSVLRQLRERNDLTTEQAGRRINTSARRWESWEYGYRRPTFAQAMVIAKEFHITVQSLRARAPTPSVEPTCDDEFAFLSRPPGED